MDVYGIQPTKKSTSGKEYFGFSLNGSEEYYNELHKDIDKIQSKFGITSKRLLLLASIKLAAATIK